MFARTIFTCAAGSATAVTRRRPSVRRSSCSSRRALEIDPQEPFATTWLAQVLKFTSREDEAMGVAHRLRQLSDDPFYVTATHLLPAWVHLERGNLAGAEQALRDGIADSVDP